MEALQTISNQQCDNYCNPTPLLPTGITSQLGLGVKYCIKTPRPTNKLNKILEHLQNKIRRIYHFKYFPLDEDKNKIIYIPGLYISADWIALECPEKSVEDALNLFTTTII